jgi:hypothetical protein
MRTGDDIDRLIAELKLDRDAARELFETNARAKGRIDHGAVDQLDYMALGYTIHNLYGVIENACLRISKFFENGLPSESWHRELLNRMLLEIPNIRPSFLTRDEFNLLDDLRAFRHVFRNLYNRPVDVDRLELIERKVPAVMAGFDAAVSRYESFLSNLRTRVDR